VDAHPLPFGCDANTIVVTHSNPSTAQPHSGCDTATKSATEHNATHKHECLGTFPLFRRAHGLLLGELTLCTFLLAKLLQLLLERCGLLYCVAWVAWVVVTTGNDDGNNNNNNNNGNTTWSSDEVVSRTASFPSSENLFTNRRRRSSFESNLSFSAASLSASAFAAAACLASRRASTSAWTFLVVGLNFHRDSVLLSTCSTAAHTPTTTTAPREARINKCSPFTPPSAANPVFIHLSLGLPSKPETFCFLFRCTQEVHKHSTGDKVPVLAKCGKRVDQLRVVQSLAQGRIAPLTGQFSLMTPPPPPPASSVTHQTPILKQPSHGRARKPQHTTRPSCDRMAQQHQRRHCGTYPEFRCDWYCSSHVQLVLCRTEHSIHFKLQPKQEPNISKTKTTHEADDQQRETRTATSPRHACGLTMKWNLRDGTMRAISNTPRSDFFMS